jgi:hypothetical protein
MILIPAKMKAVTVYLISVKLAKKLFVVFVLIYAQLIRTDVKQPGERQ